MSNEKIVFKTIPSTDSWGITGEFVLSDGGKVIYTNVAEDDDEDEKNNGYSRAGMTLSEIPDELKTMIVVDWILKNVCYDILPPDPEVVDTLVYNLVHLARDGHGFKRYNYEPEQDEEIESWDI